MKTPKLLLACATLCGLTVIPAFAQGTAFTYQGVLHQSGAPANGTNDLTFTLYNAFIGGFTVGTSNVVNDLVITNGLFTVTLDFGAGAFDGTPRSLQIAVRPGASTGAYTNLEPRQSVRPTPYAIYAGGAAATGLTGTLPASALAGVNGGGLINLNATNLVGTVSTARLPADVALRSGGNTFSGAQIITDGNVGIGTASPAALLHVQDPGAQTGRIHVGGTGANGDPKLISFGDGDFVFIGENGADDRMELRATRFEFVEGNVGIGTNDPAWPLHVVRYDNGILAAESLFDALGPQLRLKVGGDHSQEWVLVVNGSANGPVGDFQIVQQAGGSRMVITTNGNVGIGTTTPSGRLSVSTALGTLSIAEDQFTPALVMSGGPAPGVLRVRNALEIWPNTNGTTAGRLDVRGTNGNTPAITLNGANGTVTASNFVGNGSGLTGVSRLSGGNTLTGSQFITGGNLGIGTTTPGSSLEVAGGIRARGGPPGATGGNNNGYAFGSPGDNDSGLFSLGDGQLSFFINSTERVRLDPNGNVGIGTTTPQAKLDVVGDIRVGSPGVVESPGRLHVWSRAGETLFLNPHNFSGDVSVGGGSGVHNLIVHGETTTTAVNITSDRNAKEQFKPVNAREVLAKVAALPITEWQYKTQGDARHIGPMAQDFREAFALGRDEKHITSVDADGVALAAIQGLNELVQEQRRAIKDLEARNRELEERLAGRLEALEKMYSPKGPEGRP